MDEKTAKKIRQEAIWKARKFKFPKQEEDIAQDVVCKLLSGKGKNQTIEQSVIDVIRKMCGHNTTQTHDLKKALRNASSKAKSDKTEKIHNEAGDQFHHMLGLLKGTERAVVCLQYLWGLTQKEIGYCYGVHESRICQILASAEATILRKL